ncbi:tRNA modification GTPase MnmE [Clostridium sp. CAG:411]|jgi:tRNA modification GTPase|nr:tRNA uridine-5-carboxymethylaminomethyl(34) synthesis GTPase MnmE [Lachnospiraceae bacterium]CDE46387.1 tRNA modification GTPase MnmE [Clostridium sp. CAG:411]
MKTDTIAAVATGMSNGGISIVRISGEDAFDIIDRIYRSKSGKKILSEQQSHTVHYGYIYDGEKLIDEVLVVIMKAPNTYTREHVVEINCHGGITVTRKVLETVIKYGARTAEPGEFTKRAFLNGRLDLSQAEAVIDVINAKNSYALSSSLTQLRGSVLEKIREVRESILHDTAFIETALDDPEHISVDGFGEELLVRVEENIKILNKLVKSADNGRILKEGIETVILGKPNAGKSSLLNVLLGEERAIVTDIEGTTRDTLEETILLDSVMLHIKDTAGIRETADVVEQIGVEKARDSANQADLILYVVDSSRPLDENDRLILEFIQEKLQKTKVVVLLNKQDLDVVVSEQDIQNELQKYEIKDCTVLAISAKLEQGIPLLEDTLKEMFYQGKISFNDEVYITNMRQKEAIAEGLESLKQVKESILNQMPEDFYSIDLMNAYEVLGQVIGETVEEDLVNKIFSEFCVGK